MAARKRLLHIGLGGPINEEQVAAGFTADAIQSKVKTGAQKAHDSGKYEVQLTFVDVETFSQSLDALRKELQTGNWDALVIGGGIRFALPLTPKFEQIVNTAREAAPQTKILFQMAPDDIYETAERGFPGV